MITAEEAAKEIHNEVDRERKWQLEYLMRKTEHATHAGILAGSLEGAKVDIYNLPYQKEVLEKMKGYGWIVIEGELGKQLCIAPERIREILEDEEDDDDD